MKSQWLLKTDPEQHPVRFLASIWQQQMHAKFGFCSYIGPKEKGQLKSLRLHVGDLTRDLIEWVVDPVNWWLFSHQVPVDLKIHIPLYDRPNIGFLLLYRGIALSVMRSKLIESNTGADFIKKLDQKNYESYKKLIIGLYANGNPELLAKVDAAKTLIDMQKLFIQSEDETDAV